MRGRCISGVPGWQQPPQKVSEKEMASPCQSCRKSQGSSSHLRFLTPSPCTRLQDNHKVWRQKAEVLHPCSFLPNSTIRSNSFNCFEPSVMQTVAQRKQKIRLEESLEQILMDQFARHRTYWLPFSGFYISNLIHQHKNTGGALQSLLHICTSLRCPD